MVLFSSTKKSNTHKKTNTQSFGKKVSSPCPSPTGSSNNCSGFLISREGGDLRRKAEARNGRASPSNNAWRPVEVVKMMQLPRGWPTRIGQMRPIVGCLQSQSGGAMLQHTTRGLFKLVKYGNQRVCLPS